METYAALRPAEVKSTLDALLRWITSHRDQVIVILSLGLGLYLMAKSIYGLVSVRLIAGVDGLHPPAPPGRPLASGAGGAHRCSRTRGRCSACSGRS